MDARVPRGGVTDPGLGQRAGQAHEGAGVQPLAGEAHPPPFALDDDGAVDFGPLDKQQMIEIDTLVSRV